MALHESLTTPTTTLVLCGGRGERMGPEYKDKQKVLTDVGGITLLEQVVRGVVKDNDHRGVALLTGHAGDSVVNEVRSWDTNLSDRVIKIGPWRRGEDSLAHFTSDLPSPQTVVSGNILADYPKTLSRVERMLLEHPRVPVVVGSSIMRSHTQYAIDLDPSGIEVTGMTRRTGNIVDYEVYGITPQIAQIADEIERGFPTAIKHSIPELHPRFLEHEGDWAHFESPHDFEQYLGGAYGQFDYR
jgi:NDP-sugar pyrophosphorylase family protein